jgi:hypothetical protein
LLGLQDGWSRISPLAEQKGGEQPLRATTQSRIARLAAVWCPCEYPASPGRAKRHDNDSYRKRVEAIIRPDV